MLEVDLLRTFLAVYNERSFSGAGRVLHCTQPAISIRIRRLERELGVPLFERTSGGIVLSSAGRTLLPYAERALAALQDAEDAVHETRSGMTGTVALAVVGTLAGSALSKTLNRFANEHPRVELTLRTARSTEVSDLVRRGEVTIGVRYDRDRFPGLEWTALGTERMFVVCARTHQHAGRRIRSLDLLCDERWIAFPQSAGQSETGTAHISGLFLAHGLGDVALSPVDSLTAQKRLVEAGFGIALMPAANVREELAQGTIRIIRVDNLQARIPVFAAIRHGGFLSPAAARLRDLLSIEFVKDLRRPPIGRPRRPAGGTRHT